MFLDVYIHPSIHPRDQDEEVRSREFLAFL